MHAVQYLAHISYVSFYIIYDPYFACIVCMTESSRKRCAVVSFKNLQHPCAAPGVAYIDVATRATSNK